MLVQFLNGVRFRSRTDVKHQGELRFDVLANSLEKLPMRINFAVVSVFDTKHEIDSSSFEDVILDAKIPRSHLKAVQQILWDLVWANPRIHNVLYVSHFPYIVSIGLHESFLEQDFFVKKSF